MPTTTTPITTTITKTTTTPTIKKQQEANAYVLFYASFSNTYRRKGYPKTGKLLHAGRGNILRGSITSLCRLGIGRLDTKYLQHAGKDWVIVEVNEILTDPEIYDKMCKRCLQQLAFD
jgi:hypothetical protein